MISGIGVDIVEIDKISRLCQHNPDFTKRVLTEDEQQYFDSLQMKRTRRAFEFLAGRFAAKEAFAKALGTGIGQACGFQDVQIVHDDKGAPFIQWLAPKEKNWRAHVSISHSDHYAMAQVILESEHND